MHVFKKSTNNRGNATILVDFAAPNANRNLFGSLLSQNLSFQSYNSVLPPCY